jgi:simple sugar transport system ATP-binding protein
MTAVGDRVETAAPLADLRNVTRSYGSVQAIRGVSMSIYPGEVMCLLGDNGAGKSTLVKILSGVIQATSGEYLLDGEPRRFRSPRDARAAGIATVPQDLGVVPLMSIARNFFLGAEPTKGWGPLRMFDMKQAEAVAVRELKRMGITVVDPQQVVGTLSGGERQAVAIARAVYFGARLLILDEPTSALGVKEAATVLTYVAQARARGVAVVLITHNAHHAYAIGDRHTVLNRGISYGTFRHGDITREELINMMAGADTLDEMSDELRALERITEERGRLTHH